MLPARAYGRGDWRQNRGRAKSAGEFAELSRQRYGSAYNFAVLYAGKTRTSGNRIARVYNLLARRCMARSEPDVRRLLQAWSGGDKNALGELVPFVYRELRGLAACIRRELQHTLQATALAQVCLRLVDQTQVESPGRAQFFAVAA